MKKWMSVVALCAALGCVFCVGCQKEEGSKTDQDAAKNASDPTKMKPMAAPAGGKGGIQPPGV